MKRLLVLLTLVISLSISVSAQSFNLRAVEVIATDGSKVERAVCNIPVTIDFEKSRCIIFSKTNQIIDFDVFRKYVDEDNYTVLESNATDSEYKNIRFDILVHPTDNVILLSITYNDFSYIYTCHEI